MNLLRLHAVVDRAGEDRVFVDLGVDHGVSSLALALDAIPRRNVVYGVDLRFAYTEFDLVDHPNYHRIRGDSVTVGRRWDRGPIDGVVIDTLHAAPQVLCELYYWQPLVRPGGFVVIHDTAWPDASSRDPVPLAGAGTGVSYADHAVAEYFGLQPEFAVGKHTGFGHSDEQIEVRHHAESWGMTIVHLKQSTDFRSNVPDWPRVFGQRAALIRSLMDERLVRWYGIDLSGDGRPG